MQSLKYLPIFDNRFVHALFLRLRWRRKMGYQLPLAHPVTFNEKLQWLKLHDHNPLYTTMVDKVAAKDFVAERIGAEHVIPTLAVYRSTDEIDLVALPQRFVMKCTHDSGGLVLCSDKSQLSPHAFDKLGKRLHKDFYYYSRYEWPYRHVPRRILCETYMTDSQGQLPFDYKFFCFGGKVRLFGIHFDRFANHHANFYDPQGNLLPFGKRKCPPDPNRAVTMPPELPQMIAIAERLSQGIPFVRIDLYDIDGHIYFGECTFFPASGTGPFTDPEWDVRLGEWIKIDTESQRNGALLP